MNPFDLVIAETITEMQTPTSSQPLSAKGDSLQSMLLELDRKIGQISQLKGHITQRLQIQEMQASAKKQLFRNSSIQPQRYQKLSQQVHQLVHFYKGVFRDCINGIFIQLHRESIRDVKQVAAFYEAETRRVIDYYQKQMRESKEQIKRQYKVIGLMKQEVEDLMILMKYKQNQNNYPETTTQQDEQQQIEEQSRLSLPNNRIFNNDLDVIEEETQRTLQSSERSDRKQIMQKNSHIRVEEKSSEDGSNDKRKSIAEEYRKQVKKMIEMPFYSDNKPKSQNIFYDHQNSYSDYGQNLTPKEADRIEFQQIKKSLQVDTYIHPNMPTNVQISQQQYEIENDQYTKTEGSIIKNIKSNKKPKNDHLQSIFFLDDETQPLNKTASLHLEKNKSEESKLMYHSHFLCSQQNQQHFYTENSHENSGKTLKQKFINNFLNASFDKNCNSAANSREKQEDFKQQFFSENRQQKKMIKKTKKYMDYHENADNILKKVSNVTLNYFQNQINKQFSSSPNSEALRQLSPNQINSSQRNLQNKPKTKQFLQEFRRNFNKCSQQQKMQRKSSSKSTKQNNKTENDRSLISGVMTFGKSNSNSKDKENNNQKREQCSKQKYSSKAVDQMLKQFENNNKFLVGCRKMQIKYEGQKDRKNGLRNGNGILYYSNGLIYQGNFKDGNRHGYGVLRLNSTDLYNGDWAFDQIDGQGRMRNCSIINKKKNSHAGPLGKWIFYTGEFKNNKFEGSGTMNLHGGEKFVGKFKNGVVCGEGSLYRKNGEVEHGIWQNGVLLDKEHK